MSLVTFFDRHGTAITEVRLLIDSMSYVINGVGEANFQMALTDAKATESILQFGNYVEIAQGHLPVWAGKIDPDRSWDGATIAIKAYSGEYLLDLRGTDERTTLKGTAGKIFQRLIALANGEEDLLIRPGAIYTGGTSREEELGKHVLEHVKAVADRAKNDFGINPRRDENGRLYFAADWYRRRGSVQDFVLREGPEKSNVERTPGRRLLVQRGPIVNKLTGLGDANTEGTRIRSVKSVAASIGKYGLRTDSQVFDGNKTQATLNQNTLEAVNISAWPLNVHYWTALDVGSLFDQLDLGNVGALEASNVNFQAGGYGMNAQVRIAGMKYNEKPDKCDLTLIEEIS